MIRRQRDNKKKQEDKKCSIKLGCLSLWGYNKNLNDSMIQNDEDK